MKTSKYLDRAKQATKSQSDYALAKLLGIDDSALQHYRKGRRIMDTYTATKIAQLLDINPMELIAVAEAERATDAQKRLYWLKWVKRVCPKCPGRRACRSGTDATHDECIHFGRRWDDVKALYE